MQIEQNKAGWGRLDAAKGHRQGLWFVHVAVLLFGLAGLLGKLISAPPHIVVFGRTSLAAVALVLVIGWRERKFPTLAPRHFGFLAVSGTVLAAHWFTFFHSIQISTVAIGLLSFSTFPLFVTFWEPLFFREKVRPRDVGLAVAVVVGLVLVVPEFDLRGRLTQGAFWGVVSGLTFAALALVNRKYVQSLSPLVIGAGQNAVAALVLVPWLVARPVSLTPRDLIWLALLGLFCTALAHVLFIRGLVCVRAQVASVISALEPVYGILFALLFLREIPAGRTRLGGVFIIAAVMLAGQRRPVLEPGSATVS